MTTLIRAATAVGFIRTMLNEDLVRQSLIDALSLIKKQYAGEWLDIPRTGQRFIINMEHHLNDELDALLRGTYPEFVTRQNALGRDRLKNMCL